MKRLFSALLAAAVLAGAASTVAQASPMMSSSKKTMHHTCPAGQTWVHGYKKKDGTKVKGYCRA